MHMLDWKSAARRLLRTPGFLFIVVALLTLGLATMLTLAAAASALLLRPLPYPHGERLVDVQGYSGSMGFSLGFAPGLLAALEAMPEVERTVAWDHARPLEGEHGELLHNARVSEGLLELLGARALHGRLLHAEDAGSDAAVLSESAWRARFGADPAVVGQRLRLGPTTVQVVGVVAEGFRFPRRQTALWRPLDLPALVAEKGHDWGAVQALVRLAPEATVDDLRQAVAARIEPLPELAPMRELMQLTVEVESLRERWASGQRGALALAAGAVALVLAMLTANLAGLWMERSLRRRRELAVRNALGAGTARIVGGIAAEIVLVCAAALAIALTLVPPGLALLAWLGLLDADTPWLAAGTTALDLRIVLAGGVLAVLLAGALAAGPLAVARRIGAADVQTGARALNAGRKSERARRVLVALQVAFAVSLLAGGGLLVRSMLAVLAEDPGFAPEGLVMLRVSPADEARDLAAPALGVLYESARALPGVSGASFSNAAPFSGSEVVSTFVDPRKPEAPLSARDRTVGPDWFAVSGQPVRHGRPLQPRDADLPGAVVDERFAQQVFGKIDVVGERIGLPAGPGAAPVEARIVGVAATVRHNRLDEAAGQGTVYRIAEAPDRRHASLLLRTGLDAAAIAPTLRAVAAAQGLRVDDLRSATAVVEASVEDRRPLLVLALGFAAIGLALAAVGLFAQMAFAVERRRAEFGLRLAIGATPRSLRTLALRDALRIAVPGLATGVLGAWLVGRLLQAWLYEVAAFDPVSLLAVLLVIGPSLLLAAWSPAWRASRTDPTLSLRCDG